jgi:hypothetical protein
MKKIIINIVALLGYFIVYVVAIVFIFGSGMPELLNSFSFEMIVTRFFIVFLFFLGIGLIFPCIEIRLEK